MSYIVKLTRSDNREYTVAGVAIVPVGGENKGQFKELRDAIRAFRVLKIKADADCPGAFVRIWSYLPPMEAGAIIAFHAAPRG